jgi:Predicted membrane protein (DUF2157)
MIWLVVAVVAIALIGGGMWGWPLVVGILGASAVRDKPGALDAIVRFMREYDITPAEVGAAFEAPAASRHATPRSAGDIARTLFVYLGAIFILAGISVYIGTFWNTMGGVMRVLVTLGVGYILLIVLVSALHEKRYPRVVVPLALLSALVMTGGWFVLIHEVFPRGENWRAAALTVFAVMGVQHGVLFAKYRLTVLALTTLFFLYGFMQVGLDLVGVPYGYTAIVLGASLFLVATALEKTPHRALSEAALFIAICWLNAGLFDRVATATSPAWASLVIGAGVMFTAYGLQRARGFSRLAGLGYFLGSIMAYGGLFDLVRDRPFELLYLAASASMLYACVVLQSRALLVTTVIAMLGFIGYFTAKHFSNSLGWPVTLMVMGVAFLGVGALAMRVKKRI